MPAPTREGPHNDSSAIRYSCQPHQAHTGTGAMQQHSPHNPAHLNQSSLPAAEHAVNLNPADSSDANSIVANENAAAKHSTEPHWGEEEEKSKCSSFLRSKLLKSADRNLNKESALQCQSMGEKAVRMDEETSRLVERPGWQLFAICYLVGVQSSLTTGFVNSCYSTLEKLFNFNSKFTGLIEGSFHAAIVLLVIPVSFYGRKGNKPLIMASGAALIAVGAFCYSSAEFFRDRPFSVLNITANYKSYNSNGAISSSQSKSLDSGGCSHLSQSDAAAAYNRPDTTAGDSQWIKWLFVTGMFLIGVGSTPIQTVAIAYLDQSSSHEENTGWSLGWFHAIGLLAPALGFVLSGSFLSMPIDFSSWGMSKEDDSFMGAWWMGFMLECALALVLIPVLLTLPNPPSPHGNHSLPPKLSSSLDDNVKTDAMESKQAAAVATEGDGKSESVVVVDASRDSSDDSDRHQWQEFRQCVHCLMTDKTFLCLLMHGSVLHLTTAGLTAFMPKFFETQYRMIAQIAAFVAGGVSVPAAAIGAIISGYLIKRLQLSCLGTIKMTFYAQGTCILLCTLFFIIRCPYGHVYMLEERQELQELSGIPTSDTLCQGNEMHIHCVNSQFNVYSPCLLKCMQTGDCSGRNVTVESGLCEPGECHWRVPAFMIFFVTFLVASMVAVPRIFALLRLVQDDWKTISLGIQWVFFRLLGMIPGPLVYGQIFDSACTQWGSFSMTCSNSAHSVGGGHCSFYNSATLRNYMIAATVGSLVIGELCLFFAIHFYQREHTGPDKKGFICPKPAAVAAVEQQPPPPTQPPVKLVLCLERDNVECHNVEYNNNYA